MMWFAGTAWLRPLALPDEGRYVGVAREMLRAGDGWVPTLNGLPFFHKPPLFYWLTAVSMHWFGAGVEAARAASLLAAAVTVFALHAFARRWIGVAQARGTALVLATMPLFYGGAQYANLDMLVAGCISACIVLTAQALLAREAGAEHRRWLALAFVAAALGVLAKGLIGVVLPVLVVLAWGASTRRLARVVALLSWAPGLVLFACIAAPWFIEMQSRFPGFDHYFFVVQHFQRYASSGFNNARSPWFYPVALITLTLPWSPWLVALSRHAYWSRPDPMGIRRLMLIWCAVVVVFFSIPNSKLVGYVLPSLAPLAFLIADAACWVIADARGQGRSSRRRGLLVRAGQTCALLASALCVGAVVVAHYEQPKSLRALALRLQALRHAGEPVVFVGGFFYDVPFYAQLDAPVSVVDRWAPGEVAKDSWRRELADAGSFAPAAASGLLLSPERGLAWVRGAPGAWVVGPWPPGPDDPLPRREAPVFTQGSVALWHIAPP